MNLKFYTLLTTNEINFLSNIKGFLEFFKSGLFKLSEKDVEKVERIL
ncbi:hypothetical protein I33_1960 [Bacillus subtilis subsp. subtilis str. RO-NN-1]|nr:hypothetical protein I33_1960 [Bacillus subtilis subsp. subtilis str. RO-NN-1]